MIVRFFARARELAGCDRCELEMPAGSTVSDLRDRLAHDHPRLKDLLRHAALAVNNRLADARDIPDKGAEIAVLPPVSGGVWSRID